LSTDEDDDGYAPKPYGLFIIAVFHLLGMVALAYKVFSDSEYDSWVLISVPILFYAAIGSVLCWPKAWHLLVAVVALNLGLAVFDFVVLIMTDIGKTLDPSQLLVLVATDIVRVLLLPFVLIYLLGKSVRSFVIGDV
jgi:hypothetical protein